MMMRIIIAMIVTMAILGNASISSASTFDLSKIDCEKVVYSADWGLDDTLAVMRHCTGADKEVTLTEIYFILYILQASLRASKLFE